MNSAASEKVELCLKDPQESQHESSTVWIRKQAKILLLSSRC